MNDIIRETFHSVEYDEYYASLDEKTKTKQYKGEIETARQIMNKYIGGQEDDED